MADTVSVSVVEEVVAVSVSVEGAVSVSVTPAAPVEVAVSVTDGREVELRRTETGRLEWRYAGEATWRDLGEIAEGPPRLRLGAYPRGESISGARAVYLAEVSGETRAFAASSTDPAKAAVGFVVEAGAEGAEVDVWESGPLPGVSGIAPGAVYWLGAAGQFVAAPPAGAAVVQRIGYGATTTQIFGRIGEPVTIS
jgi:hypothetical protein